MLKPFKVGDIIEIDGSKFKVVRFEHGIPCLDEIGVVVTYT